MKKEQRAHDDHYRKIFQDVISTPSKWPMTHLPMRDRGYGNARTMIENHAGPSALVSEWPAD